jgi:predicted secreted hydrolase
MRYERAPIALPRRRVLAWLAATLTSPVLGQPVTRQSSVVTPFAEVVAGYRLRFPRDEASHPDFRVEWWYVTGWLDDGSGPLGCQITFFRVRPEIRGDNPSAFAPRQIIIAHAAISDPRYGRLTHAQRVARAGFSLAGAERERMRVWMDDWSLERKPGGCRTAIADREFSLNLDFDATQPPIEQGQNGYSRKGSAPGSASYYYSLPHLKASGSVTRGGQRREVHGTAWLDHEWSSRYLEANATGWDWIGINLDDGGALMAFRMRDAQGRGLWAGGALRARDGRLRVFAPDEVRFVPRREWQSARTGTRYPVSFSVRAGEHELTIEPLFDDQEHDTRATTGAIYWEGAVRADAAGRTVGRGYLELTGYGKRLIL